jgi:glycosyltransferase involved in cell wall biosynthesis
MIIRVVFTVGSLDAADGGPSRSVPALCDALRSRQVESSIVTCTTNGAAAPSSATETIAVPYRSRLLRGVWGRPFRDAVRREVARRGARLVHDNGVWLQTNHAAAAAAGRTQCPLIVSPRGMLEPWSVGQGVWRKRVAWAAFQRRDLRSAAALHATSDLEAAGLRALGLRRPIAVIGNGVALPVRRDRAPTTGDRTLLFLSRLHPKKGLLDLVSAWRQVRPPGWRAVIAGPDADGHRADVEAALAEAEIADAFTFVGEADGDAKRGLYERADLFVLPTYSENFGLVVAEALAYGVPVITTKAAPWRALEDHRCGWWTDVGATSLAAALRDATALPTERLREMGRNGRAHVERAHSWDRAGEQMRQLYDWVLDGGMRPSFVSLS